MGPTHNLLSRGDYEQIKLYWQGLEMSANSLTHTHKPHTKKYGLRKSTGDECDAGPKPNHRTARVSAWFACVRVCVFVGCKSDNAKGSSVITKSLKCGQLTLMIRRVCLNTLAGGGAH